MSIAHTLVGGLGTLLGGMAITIKHMFKKPVTREYPRVKPELSPAFRSAIELVRFDETSTHDCIACMQCVNICPSFCITVDGTRYEGVKGKRAEKFDVDYSLCSLCGLCIDVCPTDTLGYSKIYDVVGFDRHGFTYDLLDGFREDEARYIARLQQEARVKADAAAAKKAAAEKAAAEKAEAAGDGAPSASGTGSAAGDGAPRPQEGAKSDEGTR